LGEAHEPRALDERLGTLATEQRATWARSSGARSAIAAVALATSGWWRICRSARGESGFGGPFECDPILETGSKLGGLFASAVSVQSGAQATSALHGFGSDLMLVLSRCYLHDLISLTPGFAVAGTQQQERCARVETGFD